MVKKEVTVDEIGVDMFVTPNNDNVNTTEIEISITIPQIASSYFTPQCLYALNECCLLAINNPSSITSSKYWTRQRSARDRFEDLDPDTQAIWEAKS